MNKKIAQTINLVSDQMMHAQINYLLFMTYNTMFNADPTLEVWGVFLDISKAFDKVYIA